MKKQPTDGTYKWLLRLADGNCIETVFIPEKTAALYAFLLKSAAFSIVIFVRLANKDLIAT